MIKKLRTYKRLFFYRKLIKKNDLCFDIGANIGTKSKLFLSLGAKVIAFEPQSSCLTYLKKIKNNAFKFYQLAVGSKNEEKELSIGSHIEVSTFSKTFINYYKNEGIFWNSSEKVTVVTLNYLIKKYGIPNFCKIDVEGYEIEVLKNLSYKIPIIEFEFTAGFINETILIIEKIDNLGDCKFNYILNENPKFESKKWLPKTKMINEFKKLPIPKLHGNIFVKTN